MATVLCGFGALLALYVTGSTLNVSSFMLQPLAIAVIGGVAVSMVLSLPITPVLFCLLRERGL